VTEQNKAIFSLAVATLFWGLSFSLMKALGILQSRDAPDLSLWEISCISIIVRFVICGLVVLIFCAGSLNKITKTEIVQGLSLGFFGGIGLVFQMDGVNYTEASTAAFLTQAYCVIIPLVAAIHQRKLPGRFTVMACLMVCIGILVLSNVQISNLRIGKGEAEVLLASLLFTFQILLLEHRKFSKNNMMKVSLVMFLSTALIVACMFGKQWPSPGSVLKAYGNWKTLTLMAVMTLGCTLIPYLLMNRWQSFVSATQAALIYSSEPLFASFFALFLPVWLASWTHIAFVNEEFDRTLIAGGLLITAANFLMIWGSRRLK
jgi:drug/metabolite transporter (DMT)-like permease